MRKVEDGFQQGRRRCVEGAREEGEERRKGRELADAQSKTAAAAATHLPSNNNNNVRGEISL